MQIALMNGMISEDGQDLAFNETCPPDASRLDIWPPGR